MVRSAGVSFSVLVLMSAATVAASAVAQEQGQSVRAEKPDVVVRGQLPDRDSVSRSVYIGDLDLATPQGVAEMNKRIARAVNWICEIPAVIGHYRMAVERPCKEEGWASARPQMDRAVQLARNVALKR